MCFIVVFFVFKQKTAYEMRISDWSSDVCSSDLTGDDPLLLVARRGAEIRVDRRARARRVLRASSRALQFAHGCRVSAAQVGGLQHRHSRTGGGGNVVRARLSVAGDGQ